MSDLALRSLERQAHDDPRARERLFRARERAGDLRAEHFAAMARGTLEMVNLWALGTNYATKRLTVQAIRVGRKRPGAPWRVLLRSVASGKNSRAHRSACNLDGSGVVRYGYTRSVPKYLDIDIEDEGVVLVVENAQIQRVRIMNALSKVLQGPREVRNMFPAAQQGWRLKPVAFAGRMIKASEWRDGLWRAGAHDVLDPDLDGEAFQWVSAGVANYSRPETKYRPGLRVVPS